MDVHCHLDLYPDPVELVKEIRNRDIFVLSVTTTPSAFSRTSELALGCPRILTGVGLHPQLVGLRAKEIVQIDEWIPTTDFVGEIGLDGAPEYADSWNIQKEVFEYALKISRDNGGRILSVHSRRAATAVLDSLEKFSVHNTAILHWFSGTKKELERAIDLNCWFSIGPPMMMSAKGKDLIARMPRNRILLETDGPFTSRAGTPYLPWEGYEYGAPHLAKLWDLSQQEIDDILRNNLRELLDNRLLLAG